MADDPDRTTIEIKTLLRKLDPKYGNKHQDRVRRLEKFRNYVTGKTLKNGSTPEFYDDDFSLVMLGSDSPHAVYDDDLADLKLYSLLKACGEPSTDHLHMLKRSAKSAMALLRFLVLDYAEMKDGEVIPPSIDSSGQTELNGFAHALCTCTVAQLKVMNLELHVCGDAGSGGARGGAKEDACEVIVLLITRHLDLGGETARPLGVDELLSTANARKAFDTWLVANKSRDVQQAVKKASIESDNKKAAAAAQTPQQEEEDENVLGGFNKKKTKKNKVRFPEGATDEAAVAALQAAGHATEQLDQLGLNLYNKADMEDYDHDGSGPPTRWADSQLARQDIKLSADARAREERENEENDEERRLTEEERQRMLTRDPLSIRPDEFDLRTVQSHQMELLEHALMDLEEEEQNEASQHNTNDNTSLLTHGNAAVYGKMDSVVSVQAQRMALEVVLERMQDEERSILPTDVNFDPLTFLTIVHRNTSFEELQGSIERLDNKTDNQLQRQQNIVRDNFALFVRCADGMDIVSEQTLESKSKKRGVKQQLDKLDDLAGACSQQAKKSFKPLLDNTNEVRKVQSALAVLQRVGPLIQTPNLMRQHIEENRFSDAVKAYRRVLVIEDDCNIALLRHVKAKAAEAAREARRDLEATLANSAVPVSNLLDAIRDLGELIELAVPAEPKEESKHKLLSGGKKGGGESKEASSAPSSSGSSSSQPGVFCVGNREINVREHPPALACLLLQSAYFSSLVEKSVRQAENSTERIYRGESISLFAEDGGGGGGDGTSGSNTADDATASTAPSTAQGSVDKSTSETGSVAGNSTKRSSNKRWKYDVLEARVIATIRAVAIARNWLPRLLRIGVAAREAEKRRAARVGGKRKPVGGGGSGGVNSQDDLQDSLTAFEVFLTNISPAIARLTEHATFCSLGCSNNSAGEELTMSFGYCAEERLQTLLRAPLPPAQSAKCAQELASLVEVVHNCTTSANMLRPAENDIDGNAPSSSHFQRISLESPLEECTQLAEEAVVTVERRVCIYSFDVCARNCSMRASGSGTFDGDALLLCVQKLSEELTRPEECSNEVEKGCELVVRRCCEGLASYVRDRGDAARLRVVAECADALNGRIVDVVRQVAYLTNGQCEAVEEALAEDIMALEGTMFDDFLDNVRRHVAGCARLCWNDFDPNDNGPISEEGSVTPSTFPAYLSASLLAIVRCRAQVERALRETTIRRSEGTTYQFLAMATAADGVVDGICNELNANMSRVHGRQADRMANELQFLTNTLKNYLSDEMLGVADKCRRMLCSKAGRGGGMQGGGPDGLGAIEELERLGRVYVLCLGE